MMLLSFTVRNHKSIRDELTLEFVRPSLRTLQPRQGETWTDFVYPLAGIFGGNATGKSAILDALHYAFAAISESATSWQAKRGMPRAPFKLDEKSRDSASLYELDFVHDDRRYIYGFEIDSDGVAQEWLRDLPSTRWRSLIDRDSLTDELKIHSSLGRVGQVTRRELILSRALLLGQSPLASVAEDLNRSFEIVTVQDSDRARRLESITDSLTEGSLTFDDIVALLQVADIGVEKVDIHEADLPKNFQQALERFRRAIASDAEQDSSESSVESEEPSSKLEGSESDAVIRSMLFTHRGTAAELPPFSIADESDGTIAWLALIVPAVEALKNGGIYCVDEIDSSLHPHLLDLVLSLFTDPVVNSKGAQLIFTSHETYILSPLSEVQLDPEQVWFTDKSFDGATQLSCLADFPRHRDANVAKRYLMGRYGGTPRLAGGEIAAMIQSGSR